MNVLAHALVIAAMVGTCLQASAKSKDKVDKNLECHWLGTPQQDLCKNKQYTKGYAQCGVRVVTAYCETRYSGDVNACLYADRAGDTKDCYKDSMEPFSAFARKKGRGTRVSAICNWVQNDSMDSFDKMNDVPVPDDLCGDRQQYVFRRASCLVGQDTYTPLLFCNLSGPSYNPNSCLRDEENPQTLACRRTFLAEQQRSYSTGERYVPETGAAPARQ